jgi:hypothetical protein
MDLRKGYIVFGNFRYVIADVEHPANAKWFLNYIRLRGTRAQ